jgi:hypothetical protein
MLAIGIYAITGRCPGMVLKLSVRQQMRLSACGEGWRRLPILLSVIVSSISRVK